MTCQGTLDLTPQSYHLCRLEAGHEGDCVCWCNEYFTPTATRPPATVNTRKIS